VAVGQGRGGGEAGRVALLLHAASSTDAGGERI